MIPNDDLWPNISSGQAVPLAKLRLLIEDALNEHLANPRAQRLPRFLSKLACTLLDSINVAGLTIVAWDSDDTVALTSSELNSPIEPLAIGACSRLSTTPPEPQSYLPSLQSSYSSNGDSWLKISSTFKVANSGYGLTALPLRHRQLSVGCLAVWYSQEDEVQFNLQSAAILKIGPLLTASIQAAIRAEAWTRLQQMSAVTQEFFEQSYPEHNRWSLHWLATKLGEIYEAEGVTIFIEEEGEILPSASTDPNFEHRNGGNTGQPEVNVPSMPPTSYKRGQGLTGWVYEKRRSLRIRDDSNTIHRKLNIERTAPSHVDYDDQGPIIGQFLGAPLRFGKDVVGVVRLSRRSHLEPFTHVDESSLQFLGDLLGSALGNWRRVHQADAILASINEGIAVSLRQSAANGVASDKIVFANPGIAKLLGRSREEVEALNVTETYAPGEYEKLLSGLRSAKRNAKETGHGEYGPTRSALRHKMGSPVPVKISFRIQPNLLVRPPTYYTIAIARDLSEVEQLAEEHERLLAFLDALDVAYFRADMDGRTIDTTDADTRITGFSRTDWNNFRRTELYQNEEDRNKLIDLLRQRNGKLTRHLLELRRKGGEPFWAEVDLRLITDKNGSEQMEGFYRDVTAQIKLQRFLNEKEGRLLPPNELLAHLQEAAEFQIDYTSSIGHQIQTPLSSLLGTIENLERGVLRGNAFQSQLRRIIGQLRACSRLVRNLSYMDMVLRRDPVRVQQVALHRLLSETGQDFSTALNAKDLSLDIDIDSIRQHLKIVFGHPELLRQVLANLIDNSIKYSRSRSIIYVRASKLPAGPALDIINQGLPVPVKDRERIFERGVRSPNARAVVPHGTGLGLWLVREILNLHRARIYYTEVEEENRAFNCFRIIFPDDNPTRPRGD